MEEKGSSRRGKHPGFRFLVPGRRYRVSNEFPDFDGNIHEKGEQWEFLGANFVPYEDGLTLFISHNGKEMTMRLRWTEDEQGEIINDLEQYLEKI